ncbi:MAG: hypothetical protein JNK35_09855 [Phycisphaerae bacterium]|nr:hypothetical protein [Phycisphaerae bacterium]
MGFAYGQLIVLAGLWLLAMGCVWVIWRALTRGRVWPRAGAAGCGRCGYELGAPLPMRCPECGVSVVEGGVVTRRMVMRSRMPWGVAVLAWSVLATVGTLWLARAGVALSHRLGGGAVVWTVAKSLTLEPMQWAVWEGSEAKMKRSADYEVDVTVAGEGGMSMGLDEGTVTARVLVGTVERARLEGEVKGGRARWRVVDETGKVADEGAVGEAAPVERAYAVAGLDPTSAPLAKEAGQVAQALADAVTSPDQAGFGHVPMATDAEPGSVMVKKIGGVGRSPRSGARILGLRGADAERAVWLVAAGAGAAVWGGGLALGVWRRRRLLGEVEAA